MVDRYNPEWKTYRGNIECRDLTGGLLFRVVEGAYSKELQDLIINSMRILVHFV